MRTKPYTTRGLARMACYRCGTWGCSSQWQVCADHNTYRPICRTCDVALNAMVLTWMGHPETVDLIVSYEMSGSAERLRSRLAQSEWIVCAEALRILISEPPLNTGGKLDVERLPIIGEGFA